MKTIEEMLRSLARTEVTEFAIVSDRLPCIKVGGQFQPVDDAAPNTDVILQMLVGVGGSRYVDSLGPKPVQWSTRLDGVGVIAVTALMRDDVVQARFQVQRRDERPAPPPPPQAPPPPPPRARADDFQPAAVGFVRPGAPPARPAAPAPMPIARPAPSPDLELDAAARSSSRMQRPASLSAPPAPFAPAATAGDDFELELDDRGPVPAAPAMHAREFEFDLSPTPGPAPVTQAPTVRHGRAPAPPADPLEFDLEVPADQLFAPQTSRAPLGESDPPPAQARIESPAPSAPRRDTLDRLAPATRVAGAATPHDLAALLAEARASNASDLHLVATRPPLVRIAGELIPRGAPMDAASMERIIHAIVPPRLVESLDVEGTCDFAMPDATGRVRVNVTRQRTGYKACIRLIPSQVPTLASLGLPEQIAKATHHHQGLILVTGPTGHGKTSTLAAIVDIINTGTTHHVITVEDPVEYVHPRKRAMMSQREVGTHTKSFFSALKGSLREDPDVIVVGELRDTETVRMALSASETGHLVIGTMNTPNAAKTIDRLIDLFPPSDQAQVRMTLAGGLRLIVSQRLLPSADRTGLVVAAEILPGSVSLWSLIRDSKTYQIPSLQQRGKGLGIVRLDDSLAELVKSGKTTAEIAKTIAESPEELDAILSGKRAAQAAAQAAAFAPAQPPRPTGDAAKEAIGGIFGKAGNLFRKGQ